MESQKLFTLGMLHFQNVQLSCNWIFDMIRYIHESGTQKSFVRASPPCRVKGSWQALWRGFGENLTHPSCPGSSNLPGLFKLPAPLTVLADERCSCCAHIPGPHSLGFSESWHFWESGALLEIFLIDGKVEEPVCKITVGECHPKQI
jgi:hypothetical protein